jgi:hypothetical protein
VVTVPGPVPESYPNDEDGLDYIDGSDLPAGGAGTNDDVEVLPSASPPGVNDFVADIGSSNPAAAPTDWDRPLDLGSATRVGRKRRVYYTQRSCDCGQVLTEAEQADSDSAVCCTRPGCETEWVSCSILF